MPQIEITMGASPNTKRIVMATKLKIMGSRSMGGLGKTKLKINAIRPFK
jgi:hypothetical protein